MENPVYVEPTPSLEMRNLLGRIHKELAFSTVQNTVRRLIGTSAIPNSDQWVWQSEEILQIVLMRLKSPKRIAEHVPMIVALKGDNMFSYETTRGLMVTLEFFRTMTELAERFPVVAPERYMPHSQPHPQPQPKTQSPAGI